MKFTINYNTELINSFTLDNNGESVLKHKYYNSSNNIYFNRTATMILLVIKKNNRMPFEGLLDIFSKKFTKVDIKELEKDLMTILRQFWERGIISVIEGENPFIEQCVLQNGGVITKCSFDDLFQIRGMFELEGSMIYRSPYINSNNFFLIDSLGINLLDNKVEAYFYADEKGESELFIFQRDSLLNSVEVLFMLTKNNNSSYIQHLLDIFNYLIKTGKADEKGIILNVAEYSDRINAFIEASPLQLLGILHADSDYGDVDVYQ